MILQFNLLPKLNITVQ